jgi:hypothetical protein
MFDLLVQIKLSLIEPTQISSPMPYGNRRHIPWTVSRDRRSAAPGKHKHGQRYLRLRVRPVVLVWRLVAAVLRLLFVYLATHPRVNQYKLKLNLVNQRKSKYKSNIAKSG